MRRGFVLVLLLASLFWQSLTVAGQAVAFAHADELEHALLHFKEAGHHHHDDGTLDVGNDDGGVQHVAADGALMVVALLPTRSAEAATSAAIAPEVNQQRAPPSRPPEGPRRPPRTPA